ncbi:MAG: hypothetical protein QM778_04880 [Myxococcales bacterium]
MLGAAGCAKDECSEVGSRWCRGDQVVTCEEDDGSDTFGPGSRSGHVIEVEEDCAEEGLACIEHNAEPACGFAKVRCLDGRPLCVGNWAASCADGRKHPEAIQECSGETAHCVVGLLEAHCSAIGEMCDPATAEPRCVEPWMVACLDGAWLTHGPGGFSTACPK